MNDITHEEARQLLFETGNRISGFSERSLRMSVAEYENLKAARTSQTLAAQHFSDAQQGRSNYRMVKAQCVLTNGYLDLL